MSKSNEEIVEDLYFETGQMFFAGLTEEKIYNILYERDLAENIINFVLNEAKNNIIKLSNTIQNKPDNTTLLNETIDEINNSKGYASIDIRELEKFSSKKELLSKLKTDCVVIYDYKRILTTNLAGEGNDIHNRKVAWLKTFDIEGDNVEMKAAVMQHITKLEYDGFDYIEINMDKENKSFYTKQIQPNGKTVLTGFSIDGKLLGSITGHVDDDK